MCSPHDDIAEVYPDFFLEDEEYLFDEATEEMVDNIMHRLHEDKKWYKE